MPSKTHLEVIIKLQDCEFCFHGIYLKGQKNENTYYKDNHKKCDN